MFLSLKKNGIKEKTGFIPFFSILIKKKSYINCYTINNLKLGNFFQIKKNLPTLRK
jgi:hypothetical protein